jgi:Flp pilus assembly protein TadG
VRGLTFQKADADAAMADRSQANRATPAGPRPVWRARLRRFANAQDGAAAVEFAFVAIPFLLLVFSIIELGLTFLMSMSLENALMNVDRQIRTGAFQTNGGTAATYRTAVCGQMPWLGASCAGAITLDVRTLASFSQSSNPPKPKPGQTCWDPGGANSIVLVRGEYKWPLITPLLQDAVGGAPGDRKVSFAAVFTNEPYSETPPPKVVCP